VPATRAELPRSSRATLVAGGFIFQIDELETKFLTANSISEFSHSKGHLLQIWCMPKPASVAETGDAGDPSIENLDRGAVKRHHVGPVTRRELTERPSKTEEFRRMRGRKA
jgi:hypothetical protein